MAPSDRTPVSFHKLLQRSTVRGKSPAPSHRQNATEGQFRLDPQRIMFPRQTFPLVRKNVHVIKAGQIESGPGRQEAERGFGHITPSLPVEHRIEALLEGV